MGRSREGSSGMRANGGLREPRRLCRLWPQRLRFWRRSSRRFRHDMADAANQHSIS